MHYYMTIRYILEGGPKCIFKISAMVAPRYILEGGPKCIFKISAMVAPRYILEGGSKCIFKISAMVAPTLDKSLRCHRQKSFPTYHHPKKEKYFLC
jgi:hypothetical protein